MADPRPDEQPDTPKAPDSSTASFELEAAARIGAVLIFASSGLVPILEPDWAWGQDHHFLITVGCIFAAFLFYAVVHSFALGAGDKGQGAA